MHNSSPFIGHLTEGGPDGCFIILNIILMGLPRGIRCHMNMDTVGFRLDLRVGRLPSDKVGLGTIKVQWNVKLFMWWLSDDGVMIWCPVTRRYVNKRGLIHNDLVIS